MGPLLWQPAMMNWFCADREWKHFCDRGVPVPGWVVTDPIRASLGAPDISPTSHHPGDIWRRMPLKLSKWHPRGPETPSNRCFTIINAGPVWPGTASFYSGSTVALKFEDYYKTLGVDRTASAEEIARIASSPTSITPTRTRQPQGLRDVCQGPEAYEVLSIKTSRQV